MWKIITVPNECCGLSGSSLVPVAYSDRAQLQRRLRVKKGEGGWCRASSRRGKSGNEQVRVASTMFTLHYLPACPRWRAEAHWRRGRLRIIAFAHRVYSKSVPVYAAVQLTKRTSVRQSVWVNGQPVRLTRSFISFVASQGSAGLRYTHA